MTFSRPHKLAWWLAAIIVLLVLIRLALPALFRHYFNQRIANMGAYHGQVGDVELHLWRGSYTLVNLRVDKIGGPANEPFLLAPHSDVAMSYGALLRGHLRGKVVSDQPIINFIDGKNAGEKQTGIGVDWSAKLNILIPAQLDEVTVHGGTVTFRNFVSSPRVDLKMTDVESTVTNLTNARSADGSRVAALHMTAKVLGDAPLETQADFDPEHRFGDFDYHIRVTHIQLVRANDLARAYTGLDFAAGTGDFTMELRARNSELRGYAQPVFKDLQLFSWKQDVEQEKKGPVKLLYEAAAQGVVDLLKNPSNGQFATRVPINGRIDDKQVEAPTSILNVLRNAFLQAYKPQLDHLKPRPDAGAH